MTFNLSENVSKDGGYNETEVKEFIKLLKDLLNNHGQGLPGNRLFRKIKYYDYVIKELDKLAGDKLI